jgi:hypothetical protein
MLAAAVALVAPPLLGVALVGGEPTAYLEWPPRPRAVTQPGFSLGVFGTIAAPSGIVFVAILARIVRTAVRLRPREERLPVQAFPWWGAAGTALLACSWALAWTRTDWFAPYQIHTFTPLWLGYILVVNALTVRRSGTCPMLERPARFGALFVASGAFWWFFEYLNLFVGNWHYVGVDHLSDRTYTLLSSAAFATVLPAVVSTTRLLQTSRALDAAFTGLPMLRIGHPRRLAAALFLAGLLGITGIGVWPQWLFPVVWLSPLLVIEPLRIALGARPALSGPGTGDWRALGLPACAALACGVCWELWNHYSLAHWVYSVPYVDVLHVFRMPLIGYVGYLPFGAECIVVSALILGTHASWRPPDAGVDDPAKDPG